MAPDERRTSSEPPAGLQAVGLSAAEDAAYEMLVDRSPSTLHQLTSCWNRPEDLGSVLADLRTKGLVTQLPEEPARYSAVAPDIAVDALLLDGEQQLRRARAHADRLVARYRRQAVRDQPGTIIEVVSGNRAIRQRVTQIQRGTRNEIRCLDQPPYIDLEGSIATELELLASGVSCRTIYDGVSVEQPEALPGIEQLTLAGQRARVLPRLPMKLYLSDDRFAVLPLQREADLTQAAIIVHPSALLEALGNLFEGLWQHALPLDLPATAPSRRGRSTADDQRIIVLLLSGLTDEAIARQLGVSYRTAQRRIAALIERLGVQTRFQAGVQAALRETSQAKE
jgi:DNA-binding CsgD family transcriptional regulator